MPYDSLYIDDKGQTWSIRELLASDRQYFRTRLSTASLWSRTSFHRCWGGDLPSPAYILSHSRRQPSSGNASVQYADTVEDHELRIACLIGVLERCEPIEPLVIGIDGALWDGMHRLAALYACRIAEVDVLDFSCGSSTLLHPAVSLDDVFSSKLRTDQNLIVLRDQFFAGRPYHHIFVPEVFDQGFAAAMLSEIEGLPWTLSTTEFYEQYEVSLIDTEQSFNNTALDRLRDVALSPTFNELISGLTGQGKLKVADVACHRSMVAQQIGIHNDFYHGGETCRFTIHLNPGWQVEEGGLFVTFSSENSDTMTAAYLPSMNSALLFEISPKSFHAVTAVTSNRPRYSIVISFLRDVAHGQLDSEATQLAEIRENNLPLLRPDVVDVQALRRLKSRRCAPMSCGGVCCKDGAGLLPDETSLLKKIAVAYADELRSLGVHEASVHEEGSSARTSVINAIDERSHCSWLMPDGRCSLQVLSENHTQQPWFYKPLACILMPLRVRSSAGARVLTADRRLFESPTAHDPCLKYDETVDELESVEEELEFIAKVWDIDVHSLIDARAQRSLPEPSSNEVGIITATRTHVLTAIRPPGSEHIEVLKTCRSGSEAAPPTDEEKTILRKLNGRWFPALSEIAGEHNSITAMSFVPGHIPLNVWLNTRPCEDEVRDVARDLLRALIALEEAHVYHLDLAPRNVLVDPLRHRIVIVDFEDAIDSEVEVECAGGSFGFAAPEQYLNYLGLHSRLTESFFVGAVLYHAFANPNQRKDYAFPFSDFRSVPESTRGLMLALTGDPAQFYSRNSRWSAGEVLAALESGRPCDIRSKEVTLASSPEEKERRLQGAKGETLLISRRGLTLFRDETIIARWNGLVDVMAAPAEWIEPLRIGPFSVSSSNGFHRSNLG